MFVSSYTTIYFFIDNVFFECLNFSEYDIRMCLFVFWLKNRPSIKYVRNWGNRGGAGQKTGHSFGWLQANVVEYFLCIGSAKYTRASPPARIMSLFSCIIITIILSYEIIRI